MRKLYILFHMLIGGALLLFSQYKALAQTVSMTGSSGSYHQDFNSLISSGSATWADNSSIANWYAQRTGSGSNIVANNGSSNTGNLYSYGTGTSVDRALGSVGSGTAGNFAWGVQLQNNTGAAITNLTVAYTGEQWRNSGAAAQSVTFWYKISNAPISNLNPNSNTGWTQVTALTFASPVTGGTATALDGNASANRVVFSATPISSSLSIPNGHYIMIKWDDPDHSGADHGLAIDDVTIAWGSAINPPPTAAASAANVTTSGGTSYSFTVTYTDNTNIDVSTLDDNDIVITGPGSFSQAATFVSATPASNAPSVTATYSITPPGGFWDAADNGAYNIVMQANQVSDDAAATVAAGNIGSFTVNITGPLTIAAARAMPFGSTVTVTGTITVANQHGKTVFIQDNTGGIALFDNTAPFLEQDPDLLIGKEITVTGTLSEFDRSGGTYPAGTPYTGLTQISPISSYTIGSFVGAPAPKNLTLNTLTEADEGELIEINDVTFDINSRGIFVPNASFNISDASGNGILRTPNTVFNNFNLLGKVIPATSAKIVGILSQFQGNYQIVPRLISDVAGAASATTPHDGVPTSETLDIVTLNVEWFGHPTNGPSDDNLQRVSLAAFLNHVQADIYVLQEICNVSQFNQLVAAMPGYAAKLVTGCYSNRPPSPTPAQIDDGQKIAFVYKTSVITPDATFNGGEPLCYLSGYPVPADYPQPFGTSVGDPTRFWASGRFPALFVVDATINGVTRKLHLFGIHARANTSGAAAALERYNMRKFDINAFKQQLDGDYPNAAIIVAGDFNDDVDFTVSENPLNGSSTYDVFVNDPAAYDVATKSLSLNGWRSYASHNNMIDHIMVSNELFNNHLAGSELVIDPYSPLPNVNFSVAVTDHLPVTARFQLADIVVSTNNLPAFSTTYGTASANQTFTVNGSRLSDAITITAPAGFEVSVDGTTFSNSITIGTPPTISATTIYVRLKGNNSVAGSPYSGNITITSLHAPTRIIAIANSTVNPKALTVTGSTAQNKVYDGTTAATITGASLVGVIGADNVTLSGGGSFNDKNVGTNKPVTAAFILGGSDASNYILTQPTGLQADITPAEPVRRSFLLLPQGGQTVLLSAGVLCQGSAIRARMVDSLGRDASFRLVVSDPEGNFTGGEGFVDARLEGDNTLISYQTHGLPLGRYRVRIDVHTSEGAIIGIPSTATFELVASNQVLGIEEGISLSGVRTLRSTVGTGNSWRREGVALGNSQTIEASEPGWYELTVQAGKCIFTASRFVSANGRLEAAEVVATTSGGRDGFCVYPNPSKGMFTVQGRRAVEGEAIISDLQGRIISRQSIGSGQLNPTVDLGRMSAGVYLLQIRWADGKVWTEKLVKE
jgi:endonuclease/exonuclease/phosphatase family metal-dependent hydrolase